MINITRTLNLAVGRISPTLLKPVMFISVIVSSALVLALAMLVLTSWQTLNLIRPANEHLKHLTELHDTAQETEKLLVRHITNEPPPTLKEVEDIRDKLTKLLEADHQLSKLTPARLMRARAALQSFKVDPRAALIASLVEIREVVNDESKAQEQLINEIQDNSLREYRTALAASVGLPVLAALTILFFKSRILGSFDRLSDLLERVAKRDFAPTAISPHDKDLEPVLNSYNMLVSRLAAAEAENLRRRTELEDQVRLATRAVLQQGRALADADRLASVGEASARIAHELRNPLAGIELGLKNMKSDIEDEDEAGTGREEMSERLAPMIDELQRMSRLLTSLLDHARQPPETATRVDVKKALSETAVLARYQTPDGISILTQMPDEAISCLLPKDTLRQIVFNLLLNAVQAIGDKGGQVVLALSKTAGRADAGHLDLEIRDTGPGFPGELLQLGPRTFMTRRTGGTGLGLSTVARLVDQIGGRMQISNAPQGGAVVTLTLPYRMTDA